MTSPSDDRRLVGAARGEVEATGVRRAAPGATGEQAGDRIHRYTLIEPLGEGGMGTVWRAAQSEPVTREVALKIVKLGMDTREVVARFESERQTLAMLDHPHIAKVLDGGSTETGRPFFVMELVHGGRITESCDERRLDVPARLRLFISVCEAVHHAHQRGVIHRDLKPGNVLVSRSGDEFLPKVIDFGIAKATGTERDQRTLLTRAAQVLGTPEYMAPEQMTSGPADVDTRVDIYALGVLLYELLTGARPFQVDSRSTDSLEDQLRRLRESEPTRPSTQFSSLGPDADRIAVQRATDRATLVGQLRGDLDWIVLRALERERERRYPSAHDFAADVQRFLDLEPVHAVPPSAAYRLRKLYSRRRTAVLGSAALLLLLVAGSAGTGIGWWNTRQANARLESALRQEQAALVQARNARAAEAEQRRLAQAETSRARDEAARASQAEARAQDEARRAASAEELARAEAERAGLAEAAAEQRAADLAQLAAFEAEQLQGLDVEGMGQGLRSRLLQEATAEEAEALRTNLAGINFTSLALGALRTHLLDQTLAAIDTEFAGRPTLQARLLASHATSRLRLGLPAEAAPLHARAVALWAEALGPEHLETLAATSALAEATYLAGDAAEALRLGEANLAVLERVAGPDHPETLAAFDQLGSFAYGAGDLARAHQVTSASVERMLAAGRHDEDVTWRTIKGLATITAQLGRRGEALDMNTLALAGLRRLLPPDDPEVLGAMHTQASLLAFAERFDEAAELMAEALEALRRTRGDLHPETLAAIENLGHMSAKRGDMATADALLNESYAGYLEALGPEHPETLESQGSLASLYLRQGRTDEAVALLEESIAAQRRILGADHPDLGQSRMTLAEAHLAARDHDEAEREYRELLADTRTLNGEAHPFTALVLERLTATLLSADRVDDAAILNRQALTWRREALGSDHVLTLQQLDSAVSLLLLADRPLEAAPLAVDALERRRADGRDGAEPGEREALRQVLAALAPRADEALAAGRHDEGTRETVRGALLAWDTLVGAAPTEPLPATDGQARAWRSWLARVE